MKKVLIFITSFLCTIMIVMAQQTISGKVTDDTGEGLPGVNVVIKGTTTGAVTDFDGNYQLSLPDDGSTTLVFSFVGFLTQEIEVGSRSVIDIQMSVDASRLEEIVVTGYSTESRRETTGALSIVKARDIQAIPTGNVEQALQGRVPGVTVISNGQPGTTSKVRVRGFGALGGNQPLYVVDGVPTFTVDFLSPGDIESTTVLKDATTAAVYGARAANGVIVIETKKGKRKEGMKVTYNAEIGATVPGKSFEVLSPQEQADWTWKAIENTARQNNTTPTFNHPQYGKGSTPTLPDYLLAGSKVGVSSSDVDLSVEKTKANGNFDAGDIYLVIPANKEGTNWYDAITQNAFLTRHSIGLSNGSDFSRYYIGLSVQEQDGILLEQKFKRYTFRTNSEFDIVENKVRIGENIQGTYLERRNLLGGGGGAGSSDDENILNHAYRMSPIIPIKDAFGNWAGTTAAGFNNPENPVADLIGDKNDRNFNVEAFGNIYLEVEPIENLVLKTSFGGAYRNVNDKNYSRRTYENSENNSSFGYSQFSQFSTQWVWTNTANFNRTFGVHSISVLLGQEALNTGTFRNFASSGLDPFSTDPDFITISTVKDQATNGNTSYGTNFHSLFGQFKYNFQDKYFFSALVRRDGTSRLAREKRYGTFPAFSAAWRISEESFMQGIPFVYDIKIRGGYGESGNVNNIDPSNQFTQFGTSLGASSYDIGGTNSAASQGFFQTRIGNTDATWETSVTYNVGLDAIFLDGKLDIIVEIWNRTTEDMLLAVPISAQNGSQVEAPAINVGEVLNKGIDLSITNRGNITNKFAYEFTVNGSFLNNEIIKFAPGINTIDPGLDFRGLNPVLNQVNEPLSAFYGFKVAGLFKDEADVKAHAKQTDAAPGRFKFEDINKDGKIDQDDRTVIGNPIPDFTGGFNIKLNYNNWEVTSYSFVSIGNEIYNLTKRFTDFYALFPGAAIGSRVKKSWTFENPTGDIPLIENTSNFSNLGQSNSYYVEDGSYFRMQNITLAYTLPSSILKNIGFENLKITGNLYNVFTITKYQGLDPSVGGDADVNFGLDVGNVPITRSWTFGINATF